MDQRPPGYVGSRLGSALQVAAALVVAVVVLAAIEGACTLYLRDAARRRSAGKPEHAEGDAVTVGLRLLQFNPVPLLPDVDLLWRNQPNARKTQAVNPRPFGRHPSWTLVNDSEGLRGPERPVVAGADDVYRILCVGDSVTFGYNVDQEETYPRRLEQALRRRYPGRRIDVVNAGVPGWTWVQGRRFLEVDGTRLRPDLVIAAHGVNDRFWRARITDSEHLWLLQNPLLRALAAGSRLLLHSAAYRTALYLAPPPDVALSPGCEEQIHAQGSCHRVSLEEIEGSVLAIRDWAVSHDAELLLMNLDFFGTDTAPAVRRASARAGVPLLDLVPRFHALRLEAEWRKVAQLGLAPARIPAIRVHPHAAGQPTQLLIRIHVPDADAFVTFEGRPFPSLENGDVLYARLHDDGIDGDEVAGDRVFSAALAVPPAVGAILYKVYRDGAAEFEPLPPLASNFGGRMLRFGDDSVSFVEEFGEAFLMAETVHPNGDGQAVIAAEVVEALPRVPSFAAFAARQGRRGVDAGAADSPQPTSAP